MSDLFKFGSCHAVFTESYNRLSLDPFMLRSSHEFHCTELRLFPEVLLGKVTLV